MKTFLGYSAAIIAVLLRLDEVVFGAPEVDAITLSVGPTISVWKNRRRCKQMI